MHHLIESSAIVKVFTNYSSTVDVLNSRSLKTSSSVRQNLRYIRASQFISQYLNVRILYRASKEHVNTDALSQLIHRSVQSDSDVYGFNTSITHDGDPQNLSYTTSIIGFSPSIFEKLKDGYRKDWHFTAIYDAIKKKVNLKTLTLSE